MDASTSSPITHTGELATSEDGKLLRFPLYPDLVRQLLGVEKNGSVSLKPKQIKTNIGVQILVKNIFKAYWSAAKPSALLPITYEKDWHYNEETNYVDIFRNLKMRESTGLSIASFLNLPYDLAIDIMDKEIKRADKEIKEDQERKRAREQVKANQATKERLRVQAARKQRK